MKRKLILCAVLAVALLSGCASTAQNTETAVQTTEAVGESAAEDTTQSLNVAADKDKAKTEEVGYEGMESVYADSLKDGVYSIGVDSSSSMFKIVACELTVADGKMTAKMTMSGKGYESLYMGTAEAAAAADESGYIKYTEENDAHCFTVPVEALDTETDCAAFSKKKQLWYDRKLVFRADSLPLDAYADGVIKTAESLALADGEYKVAVALSGGSGRASVTSPAKLTVKDNKATAEIVWSSNKYDYMIVDGEKYLPVSTEEFSVFEIPVMYFDKNMPVLADTTAMSQPYEIDYSLKFDSSTIS